jgi:hypothetical protein
MRAICIDAQRELSRGCVEPWLTVLHYLAAVTEDDSLRSLPLADRLRIATVDLATTGAPTVLVAAVWEASEELQGRDETAR